MGLFFLNNVRNTERRSFSFHMLFVYAVTLIICECDDAELRIDSGDLLEPFLACSTWRQGVHIALLHGNGSCACSPGSSGMPPNAIIRVVIVSLFEKEPTEPTLPRGLHLPQDDHYYHHFPLVPSPCSWPTGMAQLRALVDLIRVNLPIPLLWGGH